MPNKILIIMHSSGSSPGKVGSCLQSRGYELDARKPMFGDALPSSLDDYHAAVVFGGPQSANDDHKGGIKTELDWIDKTALPSGKPVLGICLGAQQISRVLGAKVGPHADGHVEVGYHSVEPTPHSAGFLEQRTMFYQWHRETFEIPVDAIHLASNDVFPSQAYQYNNCVYGIEFHPEMTFEMVQNWSAPGDNDPAPDQPGMQCRDSQLQGYQRFAEGSDRWLHRFLDELFLPATTDATSL